MAPKPSSSATSCLTAAQEQDEAVLKYWEDCVAGGEGGSNQENHLGKLVAPGS